MMPCEKSCGIVTLIQNLFWPVVKKILPQFSQGETKESLVERIKAMVVEMTDNSISIDGSAFDSTQAAKLMEVADN